MLWESRKRYTIKTEILSVLLFFRCRPLPIVADLRIKENIRVVIGFKVSKLRLLSSQIQIAGIKKYIAWRRNNND